MVLLNQGHWFKNTITMDNFFARSVTGILFVALIAGSLLFSSFTFLLVFLAIMIAGMVEFYRLSNFNKVHPQKITGVIIGVLFYFINFLYAIDIIDIQFFLVFIPFMILVFITEIYQDSKRPFINIAATFMGIIYVAFPFSILPHIVFDTKYIVESYEVTQDFSLDAINEVVNYFSLISKDTSIIYQPKILLVVFVLIWSFDTMSYLFGLTFGRNKLFEKISPKKTWEGFLGGAASTLVLIYFISVFYKELSMYELYAIGGIVIIIGTYGDLTESMLKRAVGVKDSGKIMPGHGGILDRFDSFILAIPLVFTYLQLVR
ncbi:MAG TPA: hypothetical protein DEA97_19145 [Bacteroidales bacterium]|nr:hypothetical protein [Bacteroidales bacterium]